MLLKGPENKSTFAANMSFTRSARVAWELVLRNCCFESAPGVLLPAYIGETDREGSGIFDPVRTVDCEHYFYPVSDRLVPDMEAITTAIVEKQIDVLLVVHYFGFVQADMRLVRSMCDDHGVILVEDCAHICLMHGHFPGTTGDYAFYSLHKFLPTETGGALRFNGPNAFSVSGTNQCDPEVLQQLSRTDLAAAANVRRKNYAFLSDQLSGIPGLTVMYELELDTVPHDFPLLIHSNRREELYFHLRDQQMPTIALYYRLVGEIDPVTFPISHEVSRNILNLPIHQDTSQDDLKSLANEIRRFLDR